MQFTIIHELWNSIFLTFRTTLVIAHPPRSIIMAHCVREWICGSPLIKHNWKLGSDSVMRQSAMVSGVRGKETGAWVPASRLRHLAYGIWGPAPVSGIRVEATGVHRRESSIKHLHPESRNSGMLFITNDHASFHFWWKENLLNHQKLSKYYEHDCLISLLTALIVKNSHILAEIYLIFLVKCPRLNLKSFQYQIWISVKRSLK